MVRHIAELYCVICCVSVVFAQSPQRSERVDNGGITVQVGWGTLAVRDEYLSRERYSGSLPLVGITWSEFQEAYEYRLRSNYLWTKNLKNYNVSAKIDQLSLGFDVLFFVGDFFKVGPSADLFLHSRRQYIAGNFKVTSTVGAFSALINAEAAYLFGYAVQIEGGAALSIFSLVGKSHEPDVPARLLSPFSALKTTGEIRLRFQPYTSVSGYVMYHMEAVRVSEWDYFLLGSDQILLAIRYDF